MDLSAKVFSKLFNLRLKIHSIISTLYTYHISWLKGIRLSKGIKFYGNPLFYRTENSTIEIGEKCRFRSISNSNFIGINHKCYISTLAPNAKIHIGENCAFSGTVIGAFKKIEFGKNVMCGANTLITDSNWHPNDPRSGSAKPVKIEDNVWLGFNAIVLKGVTIGKNSVIGAGSIVNKDIPDNVIAAGNPCKVIKDL
jgi:acetyltransferase-like isoleucine patch superfamily enzyme